MFVIFSDRFFDSLDDEDDHEDYQGAEQRNEEDEENVNFLVSDCRLRYHPFLGLKL